MMAATADRDRHPLRHPAARGRVAARARGGRRRRPVRRQVPRRGAGAEGAGGRGRRRRAGAGARAAGARARARRARPRAGRGRARPGDPGPDRAPASGSNLGVDFLPGALAVHAGRGPPSTRRSRPTSCGSTRWSRTSTARRATPTCCVWHGRLWLIDHGAALYVAARRRRPLARRRAAVPGDPRPRAAGRTPGSLAGGRRAAGAAGAARRLAARGGGAGRVAGGGGAPLRARTCARRLEPPRDGFAEEAERARA